VLFIYGVGLAALLAATGGALVAYHIDRAKPRAADFEPTDEETDDSVTTEQVEAYIKSAMGDVDLTWGGFERDEGSSLNLKSHEPDGEMEVSGMDVDAEQVHRSGVDEQVAGLAMVKGGQKTTDRSSSSVDEQTDQLAKLREQKRKEAENETDDTVLGGLLDRVATLLGRR